MAQKSAENVADVARMYPSPALAAFQLHTVLGGSSSSPLMPVMLELICTSEILGDKGTPKEKIIFTLIIYFVGFLSEIPRRARNDFSPQSIHLIFQDSLKRI